MNVVLVFGPPAVGKFTIGSSLADKLDFAFIHEHMLLDIIPQLGIKDRKNRGYRLFFIMVLLVRKDVATVKSQGYS